MKKVGLFVLAAMLMLSLVSCGSHAADEKDVPRISAVSSAEAEEIEVPAETEVDESAPLPVEDGTVFDTQIPEVEESGKPVELCDTPTMEDEAADSVTRDEFFWNLLGYDGFVERHSYSYYDVWYYYGVKKGKAVLLGSGFGESGEEGILVDLNADGTRELVSNVTFMGDGAQRCYVFAKDDTGTIRRYRMNYEDFIEDESSLMANSTAEWYEEENGFELLYWSFDANGEDVEEEFHPCWPQNFTADDSTSEDW